VSGVDAEGAELGGNLFVEAVVVGEAALDVDAFEAGEIDGLAGGEGGGATGGNEQRAAEKEER
jgi:hypothetical protein